MPRNSVLTQLTKGFLGRVDLFCFRLEEWSM